MMYESVKAVGITGRIAFPPAIIEIIRARWPDNDAGQYDAQHGSVRRIILEELLALDIDWGSCHCH